MGFYRKFFLFLAPSERNSFPSRIAHLKRGHPIALTFVKIITRMSPLGIALLIYFGCRVDVFSDPFLDYKANLTSEYIFKFYKEILYPRIALYSMEILSPRLTICWWQWV